MVGLNYPTQRKHKSMIIKWRAKQNEPYAWRLNWHTLGRDGGKHCSLIYLFTWETAIKTANPCSLEYGYRHKNNTLTFMFGNLKEFIDSHIYPDWTMMLTLA